MPACGPRPSSDRTTTRAASWPAITWSRCRAARRASAILEGIPGHETGDSRLRGFRDAVKASPGITIVASQPANWERDQGFNVFQNMLQAHADIDSVFACSDLMALGAIEAIAAAGKTGKIRVIGFDALDDAKKAIAAGTMEASVAQFPSEMGRVAVESAVKVIRGETVPAEIKVEARARDKGQREMTASDLAVGLIGLGRLGRVYARDLVRPHSPKRGSWRWPIPLGSLAAGSRRRVRRRAPLCGSRSRSSTTTAVDAVVIVTPTHTHRRARRRRGGAQEADVLRKAAGALARRGRGDAGGHRPLRACSSRWGSCGGSTPATPPEEAQIEAGRIGTPLVFKSTSRDPFRPSLEYANPKSSGGMLIDMGIHDFDLARWFMGEVATVSTIGATIAYPELATVGDIDNAVASLTFASGKLGVVDLSRSGIYGYDISTEILGSEGTVRIGYLRETPLMVMTKNSVAHDTVPYFMERFRDAYTTQLQNFAQNVQQDRTPPITIVDGLEALRLGVAATRAQESGQSVVVADVKGSPRT